MIDDQPLVRLGLAALLERERRCTIVAGVSSLREALEAMGRLKPDVVLMEVSFRGESGIDGCRAICDLYPNSRVAMFSSDMTPDVVLASLLAGANGYLLKRSEPPLIVDAVERIAKGSHVLDPDVTQSVFDYIRGRQPALDHAIDTLGIQEQKILALLTEGQTNRQIAQELSLSPNTVKTYTSSIFQKLHVSRRSQAAAVMSRATGAALYKGLASHA